MGTANPSGALKIIACFATTLDGKIGYADTEKYVRLGTDADIHHLKCVRDRADTMVMGGKTFRAYPKPHLGHELGWVSRHVIVTRGESLLETVSPQAPLFQHPEVPVTVASGMAVSPEVRGHYPAGVDWVSLADGGLSGLVGHLAGQGSKTILVEGGGEVLRLFLEARLLDELYLTVCPRMIGGRQAPGLCGGESLLSTEMPWQAELLSSKTVGNEVYLHYRLIYEAPGF